jgi:DNA-binding MarR family transcriptional regulator
LSAVEAGRGRRGEVPEAWAELGTLLKLILHRAQQDARELDTTLPQCWALRLLAVEGNMTPGRLAEELGVKMPAVTSLVTHLERRGWVHRHRSSPDRREVQISLRPQGRRVLRRFRDAQRLVRGELLRGISPDDQRRLTELLRLGTRNLMRRASADALPIAPNDRRGR